MWKVAVVVGLVCAIGQVAFAGDIEQEQEQAQRQAQDQDQDQDQGQAQSQGNAQVLTQTVEAQRQNVVQSSPTLYLGGAEEGLSAALPWGNATLGKQSEMTKLVAAHSIVSNADDKKTLEAQAVKSALRCGLLCRISRLLF